jgi:hypothetical protein
MTLVISLNPRLPGSVVGELSIGLNRFADKLLRSLPESNPTSS